MKEYFILSLKWTSGSVKTWWRPDDNGYTYNLDEAGRYPEDQVKTRQSYYNNGDSTCALLVEDVLAGKHGKIMQSVLN